MEHVVENAVSQPYISEVKDIESCSAIFMLITVGAAIGN